MRILLIVNAAASSVTARRRVVISRILSGENEVEVATTRRRGHATRLALGAARRGVDVVITLGGDGTLNEAANGLAGSRTALGVIPGGSTNVYARTLGLPEDPLQAALSLVEAIHHHRVRADDDPVRTIVRGGLGSVNGRYFLLHAGMGWDAALVAEVERHSSLKRYLNHLLFIYAGLVAFFRDTDRTSPWLTAYPGSPATGSPATGEAADLGGVEGWLCVALNSNPYTFVGPRPFDLTRAATILSPLSTVTVTRFSTPVMVRLMGHALSRRDTLRTATGVDLRDGVDELTVIGHRPVPYQVDGDFAGTSDRLTIRHHPDTLSLLVPLPWARSLASPDLPGSPSSPVPVGTPPDGR